MKFDYLNNNSWSDISREERLFCAHLYWRIRGDVMKFVEWLNDVKPLPEKEPWI